jgi:hypothetical protein
VAGSDYMSLSHGRNMTVQEMSLLPAIQKLHQFVVTDFENEFYPQLFDIISEDKEIGKSYGDLIDFWTKM